MEKALKVTANDGAMYSKEKAAARLIQTQTALGLTNAALAKKSGVSAHAWSQYRTGDRSIPPQALAMLKEEYGITADWILVGDPSGLPQRIYGKIRISAA